MKQESNPLGKYPAFALLIPLALLVACTTGRSNFREKRHGHESVVLSSMIAGTYEGSKGANQLELTIRPTLEDPSQLDIWLSRRDGQVRVLRKASMHISPGPPVYLTVRPSKQQPGCTFQLHAAGSTFSGRSYGVICGVAPGFSSRWAMEVTPTSVLLENRDSGQTLRFDKLPVRRGQAARVSPSGVLIRKDVARNGRSRMPADFSTMASR